MMRIDFDRECTAMHRRKVLQQIRQRERDRAALRQVRNAVLFGAFVVVAIFALGALS